MAQFDLFDLQLAPSGIFASARCASVRPEVGLTELTPDEEDELTELLRPLMPYYTKYSPSPPA